MKKSETCFTEGVEKSTEFSLHHFSNRAHFDLKMVLVDDLWGAAVLSATSTEKPCSWICPLLDTKCGGWDVVDYCETHSCGTVWEEFLTLAVEVGSLLRAALGPKTRASLASLGLLEWSGNWIAWFFGSPCEGETWEGKHKQWDPTSLCSEHLCRKHFGLVSSRTFMSSLFSLTTDPL